MVVTLVSTVSALPAVEPREPDLGTAPLPSICSDHLTNIKCNEISLQPELIEQRNARGHEHGQRALMLTCISPLSGRGSLERAVHARAVTCLRFDRGPWRKII